MTIKTLPLQRNYRKSTSNENNEIAHFVTTNKETIHYGQRHQSF